MLQLSTLNLAHIWTGQRALIVPLLVFTCSCGTSDSGSTGSDAGTEPDSDDTVAQVCPGACATVLTCWAELDVPACELQCERELTGTGHLIPEVARPVFEAIRDAESDPSCVYSRGYAPWQPWMGIGNTPFPPVDDAERLDKCVRKMRACDGPGAYEEHCFIYYYRYNEPYQSEMNACLDVGPDECGVTPCLGALAPEGDPWIAGLPPATGPLEPWP